METRTKVLVYGTFDGLTFSTDKLTRINVVLDGGEIVEVPEDFVVSADQMGNKYKIKLKDVIARIENFDLATKAVWINEILNKLGSDYGLHKYYAGYKQGKFDGAIEHEKVAVPQFVADWIEECKNDDFHLFGSMEGISSNQKKLDYWFREDDNMEIFARAWLDGYEVDEEKWYLVKMKSIDTNFNFLNRHRNENYWIFSSKDKNTLYQTQHTRKELEEAGLGWVFDCPGIEIEEVKE